MKILTLPEQAALEIQRHAGQFDNSIEENQYLETIKYFLVNLEAFLYMSKINSFDACQEAKITAKEQVTLGVLQEDLRKILNQKLAKLRAVFETAAFQATLKPGLKPHQLNIQQLIPLFDFVKNLSQTERNKLASFAKGNTTAKKFIIEKTGQQAEYEAREQRVSEIIHKATSAFSKALSSKVTVAEVLRRYAFKDDPKGFQKLKQQLGENLQYMIINLAKPMNVRHLEVLDQALTMLAAQNATNFSPVAYLAIFKDTPTLAASSINTLLSNFSSLEPCQQNELRRALAAQEPTPQQAATVQTVVSTQTVGKFLSHPKFMGSAKDFSGQDVVNLVNKIPEDDARNKISSYVLTVHTTANDLSFFGRIKNGWNRFVAWMTGQPATPKYRGRLDEMQQQALAGHAPADYANFEAFKKALEESPQNMKANFLHGFLSRKKANRELLASNRMFFRKEIMPILNLSFVQEPFEERQAVYARRSLFDKTYPDLTGFTSLVYLYEAQLLLKARKPAITTETATSTNSTDKASAAQLIGSISGTIFSSIHCEPQTAKAAEAPRTSARAAAG
ncbi:MAG: hypothetical protein K0S08_313 [Gammaproteobacteria bacterium]|jgi:hypothetical protein|nr:hypothetical protein [Gammaproteobacteria bacterium]